MGRRRKLQRGGGIDDTGGINISTSIAAICLMGFIFLLGLVAVLVWNNNRVINNEHLATGADNVDRKMDINVNIRDNIPLSMNRLMNPLLPPERSYEQVYGGLPINISSRGGYEPTYQQLGHLYKTDIANSNVTVGNNSDTAILPLYGRRLHNGSQKWTYYTSTDKINMIKLPITKDGRKCDQTTGCDEIYSGDKLNLPQYNGEFQAEIYDYDKPRYIPVI